jgi:hypothetical protein
MWQTERERGSQAETTADRQKGRKSGRQSNIQTGN